MSEFRDFDLLPSFSNGNHRWYVPLTVYAADKQAAEVTAMIHLGWMLQEMGVEVAWLRRR